MTYRPDMPPAEKAAAMEACAEREASIYGQTTLPLMLRDGAAAVREVERLRAVVRWRYARGHDCDCPAKTKVNRNCSCGWDTITAALQESKQ
jgi:hypothetical protein